MRVHDVACTFSAKFVAYGFLEALCIQATVKQKCYTVHCKKCCKCWPKIDQRSQKFMRARKIIMFPALKLINELARASACFLSNSTCLIGSACGRLGPKRISEETEGIRYAHEHQLDGTLGNLIQPAVSAGVQLPWHLGANSWRRVVFLRGPVGAASGDLM